mgnify:CR=1 FL=1
MKQMIVFASGSGTNFQALHDAFKDSTTIHIALLVCDHADAYVLQRAKQAGVPTLVINFRDYANKAAAEQAILDQLPACDLIVLAGYMRIIGQTLLAAFPNQIVNLHPALLPSFPGRTGIQDAYEYGVKVTGVTVHYVDAGIDSGQIIAQEPVRILPDESVDALEARIHAVEHVLLPQTVAALLK